MNLAALLAPFMMLLNAAGAVEEQGGDVPRDDLAKAYPDPPVPQDAPVWPSGSLTAFVPMAANQVHIEQRMTIRIAPPSAMPMPRDMFAALPKQSIGPRFSERKIGKCLPVAGIVGVEPNGASNLILFMRDRRMINAELDRGCRARSYYSGFYLSRSGDGKMCVQRDTLLSRSGVSCKLTSIRQLVEVDD